MDGADNSDIAMLNELEALLNKEHISLEQLEDFRDSYRGDPTSIRFLQKKGSDDAGKALWTADTLSIRLLKFLTGYERARMGSAGEPVLSLLKSFEDLLRFIGNSGKDDAHHLIRKTVSDLYSLDDIPNLEDDRNEVMRTIHETMRGWIQGTAPPVYTKINGTLESLTTGTVVHYFPLQDVTFEEPLTSVIGLFVAILAQKGVTRLVMERSVRSSVDKTSLAKYTTEDHADERRVQVYERVATISSDPEEKTRDKSEEGAAPLAPNVNLDTEDASERNSDKDEECGEGKDATETERNSDEDEESGEETDDTETTGDKRKIPKHDDNKAHRPAKKRKKKRKQSINHVTKPSKTGTRSRNGTPRGTPPSSDDETFSSKDTFITRLLEKLEEITAAELEECVTLVSKGLEHTDLMEIDLSAPEETADKALTVAWHRMEKCTGNRCVDYGMREVLIRRTSGPYTIIKDDGKFTNAVLTWMTREGIIPKNTKVFRRQVNAGKRFRDLVDAIGKGILLFNFESDGLEFLSKKGVLQITARTWNAVLRRIRRSKSVSPAEWTKWNSVTLPTFAEEVIASPVDEQVARSPVASTPFTGTPPTRDRKLNPYPTPRTPALKGKRLFASASTPKRSLSKMGKPQRTASIDRISKTSYEDMVQRLRAEWYNDTCFYYLLNHAKANHEDLSVVDSLDGGFRIIDDETKRIVAPFNRGKNHWVVYTASKMSAQEWRWEFADSFHQGAHIDEVEKVVKRVVTQDTVTAIPCPPIDTVTASKLIPKQTDANSCGPYALEWATQFILGDTSDWTSVPPNELRKKHSRIAEEVFASRQYDEEQLDQDTGAGASRSSAQDNDCAAAAHVEPETCSVKPKFVREQKNVCGQPLIADGTSCGKCHQLNKPKQRCDRQTVEPSEFCTDCTTMQANIIETHQRLSAKQLDDFMSRDPHWKEIASREQE
ncbi:uncharacterized protein EV422DRAFT_508712 [Fimicolochytrium jonesii]|uniref:uncharacterized protein n=1 Tax=Fimicolochytrium jonesii TaxID=1396493 RepID=UPI0022FEAD3C|nr:uncharacterized protein EV422DRAFT_508712 [Fimicolochytrium jonesii]KAI8817889.1 hypothetical protein EV422DRAFT_508712 [Fimicolochytrium jonesii]